MNSQVIDHRFVRDPREYSAKARSLYPHFPEQPLFNCKLVAEGIHRNVGVFNCQTRDWVEATVSQLLDLHAIATSLGLGFGVCCQHCIHTQSFNGIVDGLEFRIEAGCSPSVF